MRYNVEKIKEIVRKNPTTEIIYFWGHTPNHKKMTKSCFSQWYDVYFEVDGEQYHTTEQYMMASKARLFGDEDTRSEIMNSYSPAEYKKLGRKPAKSTPTSKPRIPIEANEATSIIQEITAVTFPDLIKSMFTFLNAPRVKLLSKEISFFLSKNLSKIKRVMKIPQNNDVKIPINNVVAKP